MRCAVCKAEEATAVSQRRWRRRISAATRAVRCSPIRTSWPASRRVASGYADDYWRNELRRRGSAASARRCCAWRRRSRIAACRSARSSISAPAPAGCSMHWRHCCQRRSTGSMRWSSIRRRCRTAPANPNYVVGTLDIRDRTFDAGVCIEVIEHLTPTTLRTWWRSLPRCRVPVALSVQLGTAGFRRARGSRLSRSARARSHRVLFSGGCGEHLRAGRVQRHRAARPRLGVPGRVRTAAARSMRRH